MNAYRENGRAYINVMLIALNVLVFVFLEMIGSVGLHAVDDAVALVELHPHSTVDGLLRRVHESLYRLHKRREPVSLVGELGELDLQLFFGL